MWRASCCRSAPKVAEYTASKTRPSCFCLKDHLYMMTTSKTPQACYQKNGCSVVKLCEILCDLMDCSMPGFLVLHYLLEFAQIHVHWVDDAIQPSHPLSPSSPPALHLSQHHHLFQWVGCSHQVVKVFRASASAVVFPINIQCWLPLGLSGLVSLLSKGLSWVFSSTKNSKASILRHSAFFMVQLTHLYVTTGKTIALTIHTFVSKVMSLFLICCLGWS